MTGQKTWSSYADIADVHFCLIRTSRDRPGRHGLSWVICNLADPRIEVRPIKTMARNHHFSEVFYDEVRVPLDQVVGGLHNGWTVAMSTLNFERGTAFLADQLELSRTIERLITESAERPGPLGKGHAIDDDHIALELAQLRSAGLALRSMTYRSISQVNRTGRPPGPEGSIIRMYYAEVRQWVARLAMEILGPAALEFQPYWEEGWSGLYLWDFGRTIGAGTAEIQRNVIGERVLGLPR